MKKYIILIISIFLFCDLSYATIFIGSEEGAEQSASMQWVDTTLPWHNNKIAFVDRVDDYSHIKMWLNFEGTWAGGCTGTDDYTMGASECGDDTTANCAGSFAEDTTSPPYGSSAGQTASGAGNSYFVFNYHATGATFNEGCFGIYLEAGSGTDGSAFFALHDNDPSNLIEGEFESSNRVTVYVEDAGVAKVALGTIVSTTNDFNTVDHYVEVCFDFAIGAGSDKVELWVDGVLEDSENGLTVTDAWTLRDIYVGNSNATAHQYTVDNIIFSNDSDAEFYNNGLYDDTSKPTGACP